MPSRKKSDKKKGVRPMFDQQQDQQRQQPVTDSATMTMDPLPTTTRSNIHQSQQRLLTEMEAHLKRMKDEEEITQLQNELNQLAKEFSGDSEYGNVSTRTRSMPIKTSAVTTKRGSKMKQMQEDVPTPGSSASLSDDSAYYATTTTTSTKLVAPDSPPPWWKTRTSSDANYIDPENEVLRRVKASKKCLKIMADEAEEKNKPSLIEQAIAMVTSPLPEHAFTLRTFALAMLLFVALPLALFLTTAIVVPLIAIIVLFVAPPIFFIGIVALPMIYIYTRARHTLDGWLTEPTSNDD
ncbi:hypothetical protein PPROV_000292800 [Pycnococcus provasolii]|uniref:Uncharacterized protein n=1 Tax=Pycnococcus provasolii TaxID=41880 RepID=A0A830HAP5_9CHLO|nr:hypothetical protein PPROV_000292800 [Pycnococcus provasolii]|mmetsp:Transcript_3109/g.7019  ORF Transcript_3109/g.7019 Transcript_3109/m.7019 type:complete len:295 (-) Transcript_3109:138-1022(-)